MYRVYRRGEGRVKKGTLPIRWCILPLASLISGVFLAGRWAFLLVCVLIDGCCVGLLKSVRVKRSEPKKREPKKREPKKQGLKEAWAKEAWE